MGSLGKRIWTAGEADRESCCAGGAATPVEPGPEYNFEPPSILSGCGGRCADNYGLAVANMAKRTRVLLISSAAIAALVLLGFAAFNLWFGSGDAEEEFSASDLAPAEDAGASEDNSERTDSPPEGSWVVQLDEGSDSGVGYRILEDLPVGGPEEITGRTTGVAGTAEVESGQLAELEITADLTNLDSGIDLRDQIVNDQYLETGKFPEATFAIAEPLTIPEAPEGEPVDFTAVGDLTIHGVTREVTATGEGQWTDDIIEVVGSVDTSLSAFEVSRPDLLGRSARDDVVVEFKVQFRPLDAAPNPLDGAEPVAE